MSVEKPQIETGEEIEEDEDWDEDWDELWEESEDDEEEEYEGETIKRSEIADLVDPIKELMLGLEGEVEKGKYEVIIGDDASGRIPALILSEIIKIRYKKFGHNTPQTIFFGGSSKIYDHVMEEKKNNFITELKKRFGENKLKVLVVTDTIQTGKALWPLTNALASLGYEVDVASVGVIGDARDDPDKMKKKLKVNEIFSGPFGTPRIYGKENLSGMVGEKYSSQPYAESKKRLHKSYSPTLEAEDKWRMQEQIKSAREDAHIVARKVEEWLDSESADYYRKLREEESQKVHK